MSLDRQPSVTLVLGMHRSGTSALTYILSQLGFQMGTELLPSGSANKKGFFEEISINEFNNRVLFALGRDWHSLGPIQEEEFSQDLTNRFLPELVELLSKRLEGRDSYLIKDPRLSRLLPLWQRAFSELKIEPFYLISLRSPLSVAASLKDRDGFSEQKSFLLWLDHLSASLLYTEGKGRLVVNYDKLVESAEPEIARITRRLAEYANEDLAKGSDRESFDRIQEFLEPGLRHTFFSREEHLIHRRLLEVPAALELYLELYNAAEDRECTDHRSLYSLLSVARSPDLVKHFVGDLGLRYDRERVSLEACLRDSYQRNQELQDDNVALNQRRIALEVEVENHTEALKCSRAQLNNLKEQLSQPNPLAERVLNLENSLKMVEMSRSWRLTKSLRTGKRYIKFAFQEISSKRKSFIENIFTRNISQSNTTFLMLVEQGVLEQQVILLCRSIRRLYGDAEKAPITVISPRSSRRPSEVTLRLLEALQVEYLALSFDSPVPDYGSSYRTIAAAYFETICKTDQILLLDSDTVFLEAVPLGLLSADLAMRPVDIVGISSTGPEDPRDRYWQEICRLAQVEYETLPWVQTSVGAHRIKAHYNAGFVLSRTNSGVFSIAAEIFLKSIMEDVLPIPYSSTEFLAGGGWVSSKGARMWGSAQAALAVAAWGYTNGVVELPASYNFPFHHLDDFRSALIAGQIPNLGHIHYHQLFFQEVEGWYGLELLQKPIPGMSEESRAWLKQQIQDIINTYAKVLSSAERQQANQ